jgi:hypothetical protein
VPKGRGARRGKKAREEHRAAPSAAEARPKGLAGGGSLRKAGEQLRRQAAVEAGGFTREERRRARQREEEEQRLAARRLAKMAQATGESEAPRAKRKRK